jgi:3D (Asp-Asp-Asp) domain-containing protein
MMRSSRIILLLVAFALAPTCQATEVGIASWYGAHYQGRPTASGAPFNMKAMTAAHRTLPFGTVVRVTNTRNRRTVDLRINDRGPFIDGRVIDLSMAAAERLGFVRAGLTPVRIDVLTLAGPRHMRVRRMTMAITVESDPPPVATVAVNLIISRPEIFTIHPLSLTACSGGGRPQGVLGALPCYKFVHLGASIQPLTPISPNHAGFIHKTGHTILRICRHMRLPQSLGKAQ